MSKTKWYSRPIYAMVVLVLVLSLSLVTAVPVAAEPGEAEGELVGSYSYSWTTSIMNSTDFDFTVGMGWSGPFPWPPNVYFFFHPDEIPLGGYTEPIGGAWLFENIDFDITAAGQTFSVTSVADDPDFEGFASLLTNGTDDVIWFGYIGDRDNLASAGGQKGVQESQVFSGTDVGTDFPGWVIQSVSLTFNQIYLDPDNVNKLVLDFTIDIYASPPPTEVWVDDDWAELNPGDPADGHIFGYNAFATIQDGIDAVAGSIVDVEEGTYDLTAPIMVNKAVTLIGDTTNPQNVVINAGTISGDDRDCFQVVHDDVTIQGFKMINATSGTTWNPGCLNGGIMAGNWGDGMWATNPDVAGLSGFDFSYNIFDSCSYGIYFFACSDAVISHNTFTGILPRMGDPTWPWDGVPIALFTTNYGTQGDCGYPVDEDVISNVTICSNIISGGCREAILVGAEMYGPGLDCWGIIEDVTIEGNDISGAGSGYTPPVIGSSDAGIALVSSPFSGGVNPAVMTNININSNKIHGNGRGISLWAGAGRDAFAIDDIYVNYNCICNNSQGIWVGGDISGTLDATYNWWGSVDGPEDTDSGTNECSVDLTTTPPTFNCLGWTVAQLLNAVAENSGTLGDKVSDNVHYCPWLEALPMSKFVIDHAKIDFKKKPDDDKVRVSGKLELDLVCGDDVKIGENVTVTVGPLSETITMMAKGKKGETWEYKRPKGGTGDIKHMTIDWKNGEFDIRMDKADRSGLTDPNNVTISIQIGDDVGEETIKMMVKKHHWDYKAH